VDVCDGSLSGSRDDSCGAAAFAAWRHTELRCVLDFLSVAAGSDDFSASDLFVSSDRSLITFAGQASQPGILFRFPFSLFGDCQRRHFRFGGTCQIPRSRWEQTRLYVKHPQHRLRLRGQRRSYAPDVRSFSSLDGDA